MGSIFSDQEGNPAFANCAVLFLDLLGTRSADASAEDKLDQLRRTKRAVEEARRLTPREPSESGLWNMIWFSDNLGLHYAFDDRQPATTAVGFLITDVGYLQMAFLREGLLARGAVSAGEFYADAEFIHGPALECAVELEKNKASSPRVILSDDAWGLALYSLVKEWGGAKNTPWSDQLLVDSAGEVFVNYLSTLDEEEPDGPEDWQSDLELHRNLIVAGLGEFAHDPHVRAKYEWLADYHNDFLRRYDLLLAPIAAELRIAAAPGTQVFVEFGDHLEDE